jgi:anti-sigma-K factor RskA
MARPPARRSQTITVTVAAGMIAIALVGAALAVALVRTEDRLDQAEALNRDIAAVLVASDAEMVSEPVEGGGTGIVVSSADLGKAVVLMDGLPDLPKEQTYELWLMKPGSVEPAGLLDADSGPQLLDLGDAMAVGVSRERAGGALTPTDVLADLDFAA